MSIIFAVIILYPVMERQNVIESLILKVLVFTIVVERNTVI